jgi:TPR repeat protein
MSAVLTSQSWGQGSGMNIRGLHERAESGNATAQCVLGVCYLDGLDVGVDYQKVFRLLSAAAACGLSRAVVNLARMYAQGLGTTTNVDEAIRLYESVGRVEFLAAIQLGRIYSRGLGTPAIARKLRVGTRSQSPTRTGLPIATNSERQTLT